MNKKEKNFSEKDNKIREEKKMVKNEKKALKQRNVKKKIRVTNEKKVIAQSNKDVKKEDTIKKDMTFAELLNKYPRVAFELMEMGLMCCGCPMAQFETIQQGCEAHGVDVKKVLKKLNSSIKEK